MIRKRLAFVLLLSSLAGCLGEGGGPQEVGWEGWTRTLERGDERAAVVYVWAPWSRDSLEALPAVVELAAEYEGAPLRFLALGVSADGGETSPLDFGLVEDFRLQVEPSEALARLEVQDLPAALLYGPDGRLHLALEPDDPDIEFSPANLADAIDLALAADAGAR